MATATETIVPRLKQRYEDEIKPALKDELELDSIMRVPQVSKITLNMGVGDAKTDAKAMDAAIEELSTIAGQHAQVRRARKSVASSSTFAWRRLGSFASALWRTRSRSAEKPSPSSGTSAKQCSRR